MVPNRIELIKFCAEKYNVKSYLELGVHLGECFDQIDVPFKIGVDIKEGSSRGISPCTTDEFFAQNKEKFDLIFVDSDHRHAQAYKDITNALQCLKSETSLVVCHDMNPPSSQYESTENKKCGDCWKVGAHIRTLKEYDMVVSTFDYGCGIIKKQPNKFPIILPKDFRELTYKDLCANRKEWLRLMDWEEIIKWL
jgi:hypothetical protein